MILLRRRFFQIKPILIIIWHRGIRVPARVPVYRGDRTVLVVVERAKLRGIQVATCANPAWLRGHYVFEIRIRCDLAFPTQPCPS